MLLGKHTQKKHDKQDSLIIALPVNVLQGACKRYRNISCKQKKILSIQFLMKNSCVGRNIVQCTTENKRTISLLLTIVRAQKSACLSHAKYLNKYFFKQTLETSCKNMTGQSTWPLSVNQQTDSLKRCSGQFFLREWNMRA